jgi:tetratricopeptide (TPR) repeat protein
LWWVLLSLALVAASGFAWRSRARRSTGDALLRLASDAYKKGDWQTARDLALQHLRLRQDDTEALRLLARSSARLGRDESVRPLYSRIGGASAMSAEDLYLLGVVLNRAGANAEAVRCFESGALLEPNRPEILLELARTDMEDERLTEAAAKAQRLAIQPGWEAAGESLLGSIRLKASDPAGAAKSLSRALERPADSRGATPSTGALRKQLARAFLRTGRPAEAREQLLRVPVDGCEPETAWLLSRSFLQERSAAAASAALERCGSYRDDHPLEPEPAPYVGSARCAGCHREIYRSQQESLHAKTYYRGAGFDALPLPGRAVTDPANPAVTHTIDREGPRLRFETRHGDKTYRALVDYAFGSGDRGLTLVGRDEQGRSRELRLSHYSDGPAWDVTFGHPPRPTAAQGGYLGEFLLADDVLRCFFCHTTVARSARDGVGPESADHGIGCERCHGPGGNHTVAVSLKFPDLAIARPLPGTGEQVVALCAQCHSPGRRAVSPSDPNAVRFQGTTLTWSRCFKESGGALDCVTCHNPHRNAVKSAGHYELKCLGCHPSGDGRARRAHDPDGPRGLPCPVNPRDGCVGCHMPTKKTAAPHTVFTDHFIRVHPGPRSRGGPAVRTRAD